MIWPSIQRDSELLRRRISQAQTARIRARLAAIFEYPRRVA